jgi:hypothetical protein
VSKYFNPKEDVIDIQLTQYGKALLSRGKFKPDSYAFFDNDILYNTEFANLAESQNDSQQRIMESTPRLQTQYVYRGIESNLQKNFDTIVTSNANVEKENIQQTEEREYALGMPIGTSDPNSINRPSWDIGFYKAPLSGAIMHHTGSSEKREHIIQLDCTYYLKSGVLLEGGDMPDDPAEKLAAAKKGYRVPYDAGLIEPYALSVSYDDDSYFYVKQDDYIFLDVIENNTSNELENFEIEVFKVEKESNPNVSGSLREILVPLKFFKSPQERSMEFPTDEMISLNISPEVNETFVEYYFDINHDLDIEEGVFCELMRKFKDSKVVPNIFSDINIDPTFDCEDFRYAHELNQNIVPHTADNVESDMEEC